MRSLSALLGGLIAGLCAAVAAEAGTGLVVYRSLRAAPARAGPERLLAGALERAWKSAGRGAPPGYEPRLGEAAAALAELAGEGDAGLDRAAEWLRFELWRRGVGVAGTGLRSFGLRSAAGAEGIDGAALEESVRALPGPEAATHFGAAWRPEEGGGGVAVFVLARERATLAAPFPGATDAGTELPLRVELAPGLAAPRLALGLPSGTVVSRALIAAPKKKKGARVRWETTVPFVAGKGEYRVELVADGALGPEVVLLFPIYVEVPRPAVPTERLPLAGEASARSPVPAGALEGAALSMINADRRAAGLRPVAPAALLDEVARAHSEEMRARKAVAHLSADGGDPADRVTARGAGFARVTENVGMAATLKAAHAAFLDSPAHRANLLDPEVESVGIGIASDGPGPGARLWVTYLFAGGLRVGAFPSGVAGHEDVVWAEIGAARRRAGLPPLVRDPAACAAAADMVRAMSAAGRAATKVAGVSFAELVRLHGAARADTPVAFRVLSGDGATLGAPWPELASPRWRRAGVAVGRTSAPGASVYVAVALLGAAE